MAIETLHRPVFDQLASLHVRELPAVTKISRVSTYKDMPIVRAPGRGFYASGDELFKAADFGRDKLEAVEDLNNSVRYIQESTPVKEPEKNPAVSESEEISREVITSIAQLQGQAFHKTGNTEIDKQRFHLYQKREEEEGRVHHEYRHVHINGRNAKLDARSQEILSVLGPQWGGSVESMTYYGSVDATPLFVNRVVDHVQLYGPAILDEKITQVRMVPELDGTQKEIRTELTIRESVSKSIDWIESKINNSKLGLLEFRSTHPEGKGIPNQSWKDGRNSYRHPDGHMVNHAYPVASIELQGHAYDALTKGSALINSNSPEKVMKHKDMAKKLQQSTLAEFWMPEREYFAQAIDYNRKTLSPQQVKTMSANPAELLKSSIFDSLPEHQKRTYVKGIVKNIMSDNFLTDWGIRSRAKEHANLTPEQHLEYQGSEAVWNKETWDTIVGLRKQGFHRLSEQVMTRMINAVNVTGGHFELMYVDTAGKLLQVTSPKSEATLSEMAKSEDIVVRPATNKPEEPQTWTISAMRAAKRLRTVLHKETSVPISSWQFKTEGEIIKNTSHKERELLKTYKEISNEEYRTRFGGETKLLYIDFKRGKLLDELSEERSVAD